MVVLVIGNGKDCTGLSARVGVVFLKKKNIELEEINCFLHKYIAHSMKYFVERKQEFDKYKLCG